MLIPSIDISNGKVVQLRQGKELVIVRDDPVNLMCEFSMYGEPTLIDLDAARRIGSNKPLVKSLLKSRPGRVGGGIQDIETAKEFIEAGASSIIVGTGVFKKKNSNNASECYEVNLDFLSSLARAIGKQRIIIALDVRGDFVAVNGWTVDTGLSIFSLIRSLEPYTQGFLVTTIEYEGMMQGTNVAMFQKLRALTSCNITAAGGIATLEEIQKLSAMKIDVQLGMAIYTGKLTLADAFIASLNWKNELLPVIAQEEDGNVLMLGYTNQETLKESFVRKKLCFYSRSRQRLWMKGETSGNTLDLMQIRADCDRDTLLATTIPAGPVCHTGTTTCFGDGKFTLETLQKIIYERFRNPTPNSYTATLDDNRVREKLMEEAEEVCEAVSKEEVIWEAADVLYFLLVLITRKDVSLKEVLQELARRKRSTR